MRGRYESCMPFFLIIVCCLLFTFLSYVSIHSDVPGTAGSGSSLKPKAGLTFGLRRLLAPACLDLGKSKAVGLGPGLRPKIIHVESSRSLLSNSY
jgi:hypothetical protein